MMHVSAATGVQAIREARAQGQPIYGETLHQYMLYTSEDYQRPNGQIYHTYPSLKTRGNYLDNVTLANPQLREGRIAWAEAPSSL
jgi:dihydroorotase-like cyclic amidohydrolase